jgi:hypothetical protein
LVLQCGWRVSHCAPQIHSTAADRDPFLLPITALLSGWGMLTVYRLNSAFGLRQTVWLAFLCGTGVAGAAAAGPARYLAPL